MGMTTIFLPNSNSLKNDVSKCIVFFFYYILSMLLGEQTNMKKYYRNFFLHDSFSHVVVQLLKTINEIYMLLM